MKQNDFVQIKVNQKTVGILGLKNVMAEMAIEYAEKPEAEVRFELMRRMCEKNYIPDSVRKSYAEAFLNEFKKFIGKPYGTDDKKVAAGLEIKILGPGCNSCDKLVREIIEILAEMELAANVEHITAIKEIGKYGVIGSPTLLINGTVMSVGKVLPRNQIIKWLKKA